MRYPRLLSANSIPSHGKAVDWSPTALCRRPLRRQNPGVLRSAPPLAYRVNTLRRPRPPGRCSTRRQCGSPANWPRHGQAIGIGPRPYVGRLAADAPYDGTTGYSIREISSLVLLGCREVVGFLEQHYTLARCEPSVLTHLLSTVAPPPHSPYLLAGKPGPFTYLCSILVNVDRLPSITCVSHDNGRSCADTTYPCDFAQTKIHVQKVAAQHTPNPFVVQYREDFLKTSRRFVLVSRWTLWLRFRVRVETLISELTKSFPIEKPKHQFDAEHPCIIMPIGIRRRCDNGRIGGIGIR